jgi:membrane-associated phospholipid phosphatase
MLGVMKNPIVAAATVVCVLLSGIAHAQDSSDPITAPPPPIRSNLQVPAVPVPSLFTISPEAAQDAATPAEPAHTGLSALVRATASDFNAFPRRKSTWILLGGAGAAALLVHPWDKSLNAHLVGQPWAESFWKPGKYVGGVGMAIAPVGIYAIGRLFVDNEEGTRTNKWSHLGFDLVRAEIVNEVLVQAMKVSVRRDRPNGSPYSFPSGHASAAFAFASVLERHLGYRAAWPTLAIAGYVATSRLHDNVHFLSDVVFGAGLGTAVGWTVVGRHGRSNFALTPVLIPNGIGVSIRRRAAAE